MIFADENLIDQGVLQDYSFDEEYGTGASDTNTFECRVQKYNDAVTGKNGVKPITQDFILYVEFTEYGGIIDRVESDTKTGEIIYSGRTWHGILNSFVIQPPSGQIYRTYWGESNEVLSQMIEDIGMTSLFVVDVVEEVDKTIDVNVFEVRYEKAYDCIIRLLKECNAKLLAYYQNGQVHLGIVPVCNYATNEEFDSSQVPFKVGYTYNNVNHLICLGQGDGVDRAVIHLFMDDGEVVQPYAKVDNPKQDSDYYLDESHKVMTGIAEIVDIYDAPNSEIITNYLPQNTKPADWKGTYHTKYYKKTEEDGETKYSLFKQFFRDEYRLTPQEPTNWVVSRGFSDYYYWDRLANSQWYRWDAEYNAWAKCNQGDEGAVLKSGAYVSVKALTGVTPEYKPDGGFQTQPSDWTTNYSSKYYQPNGTGGWTNAQAESYNTYGAGSTKENPDGAKLGSKPLDWDWNFGNYYTREKIVATGKYVYTAVQAKDHTQKVEKINKSKIPETEWSSTWTNYYILANQKAKDNKKIVKYAGKYITAQDGVNLKIISLKKGKSYPAYVKGKFYNITLVPVAPDFKKPKKSGNKWVAADVFEKYSHQDPPTFVAGRYYEQIINDIPTWEPGKYFYLEEEVEQVPTFDPNNCYYQVFDRMAMLVKSGIEKMEDMCDTSTLDINLELESNYDVMDVVGSIDEVTGLSVNKPILRKIIKIKKDIVSVDYEVD